MMILASKAEILDVRVVKVPYLLLGQILDDVRSRSVGLCAQAYFDLLAVASHSIGVTLFEKKHSESAIASPHGDGRAGAAADFEQWPLPPFLMRASPAYLLNTIKRRTTQKNKKHGITSDICVPLSLRYCKLLGSYM
jgi:hypothetical protein